MRSLTSSPSLISTTEVPSSKALNPQLLQWAAQTPSDQTVVLKWQIRIYAARSGVQKELICFKELQEDHYCEKTLSGPLRHPSLPPFSGVKSATLRQSSWQSGAYNVITEVYVGLNILQHTSMQTHTHKHIHTYTHKHIHNKWGRETLPASCHVLFISIMPSLLFSAGSLTPPLTPASSQLLHLSLSLTLWNTEAKGGLGVCGGDLPLISQHCPLDGIHPWHWLVL